MRELEGKREEVDSCTGPGSSVSPLGPDHCHRHDVDDVDDGHDEVDEVNIDDDVCPSWSFSPLD